MTKEEFKELEILVGGLSAITEHETTRLRAEKMLKILERYKQLLIHNVSGSTCKEHKPMAKQMGYVEWNEWADLKIRRGHIQRQCEKCGRWLFKCEQ